MKQIGFKNFRRFENFPAIDLAPITIFVGENNAGKSTVVKGILALSDFLNKWRDDFDFIVDERGKKSEKKRKAALIENLKKQKFYFNTSYLAHIGTFKRALYNKASDNIISFSTTLGVQDFTIDVYGDRNDDEAVSGVISKVFIDYKVLGVHLEFDLQHDLAIVRFCPTCVNQDQLYFLPPKIREEASSFLASISKTYEIKYNISDYHRLFAPGLIFTLTASVEIAISESMEPEKTGKYIGSEVIGELKPIAGLDDETIEFLKKFTEKVCVNPKGERWIFRLPETQLMRSMFRIEYLYAHAVTQTVIYSAKDTNDYLSRTIHEFASLPKIDNDYRREFITYWMDEFKIGKGYSITSVGGEAHIVHIINSDGEQVNLADKGMGSIQLMVLLFRLAISLPKRKIDAEDARARMIRARMSRIIIIEEPEQNLHPMLQSKLADLLFQLNKDYGYRFIIETHSEYLIRKTQVIVKNNFNNDVMPLSENPFKVYYFNSTSSEKPYYEIEYQSDGNFANDFGRGFFDEASNLAFEIL